jgi:hypothetical protein
MSIDINYWNNLNRKELHLKLLDRNEEYIRNSIVLHLKNKLSLEDVVIVKWLINYIKKFNVKNLWNSDIKLLNNYVFGYLKNKVIIYAIKNKTTEYNKLKMLIEYNPTIDSFYNICNCFLNKYDTKYFDVFKNNKFFWLNTNLCCVKNFKIEDLILYNREITWSRIDYSIFSKEDLIKIENYIHFDTFYRSVYNIEILNFYINKIDELRKDNIKLINHSCLYLNFSKIKNENSAKEFNAFIEKIYNIFVEKIYDGDVLTNGLVSHLSCSFLIKSEAYLVFPNSILKMPRRSNLNGCCEKLIKKCFDCTDYRDFNENWKYIQEECINYIDNIGIKRGAHLLCYLKLNSSLIKKYNLNNNYWCYINRNVFLDCGFLERYITYLNLDVLKSNNFIKDEFNKYCEKYNYI